jgi:hypothetical protein
LRPIAADLRFELQLGEPRPGDTKESIRSLGCFGCRRNLGIRHSTVILLIILLKCAIKLPKVVLVKYLQLSKILAVVAASLILPGLTLAGTDKGKGNDGQNNGNQYGKGDPSVSSVPEANPGIVLIPFVGAVLLVSWLQLSRMKAQKDGSLS